VALVARVSSKGQASARGKSDASDLERQVNRLKQYARERWGNTANTTTYISVGSGLNFERVEFLKLIDDILAGKFKGGYVVATYFDRVCRYGIQMVRQICKAGGCELVFTETDAEKECHESLADEILGILTHFTAKASGQKAKRALKVVVSEDVLKDIWQWHKAGYSYCWIERKLREQNRHKDEKGRVISQHVVRVSILENRDALEALSPSTPVLHSFGRFHSECIRRASDKVRLKKKTLMAKYTAWCEREGEQPMSNRAVGKFLDTLGIQKRFDRTGCVTYVGLSLLG
jgi:predicted site-specific integrase-resolvase